ncbi:SDR family NAD(P)-dependent oxidoreductase [Actinomadura welshii]|uniref:SDR family NAD(P)-dependent oxidoreductase n=1 Tax=Actinomadura welshii TaxID=3103817 RepID=UPI0004644CF1|nr:SDR family NAD(P)-dependent oxidoreductase [Actinomadura madurae]
MTGGGTAHGGRSLAEIIGVTPFGRPAPHLAVAVARAGGTGVLDLGADRATGRAALADARRWWTGPFGVRVPAGCQVRPGDLPPAVGTVLLDAPCLDADDSLDVAGFARGRRLLVEAVGLDEARAAISVARGLTGDVGIIARGAETGGRVGEPTTFVLLQQLLAELDVPVFAAGGIGPHTAAAAVAGGASGVVLDVQLALVRETDLPAGVVAALKAMGGTETTVVDGHRVHPGTEPEEQGRAAGQEPLPVGQDAPLAAALAGRYRTAGGVVRAVREQIEAHLCAAVAAEPLAARGEPVAAQKPMIHISDGSAFAGAVAQDGGLPFLALGLMDGDRARELLRDTADRLGGRPWGAGILGFAPPELLEAQIAAVREAGPAHAIIAGGSPAQAAPLEAAGIAAYLHVPSPELLDRFLAEGARRFVFEGAECGGHAGPRASFPLWEAQVERLMAFDGDAAELSVMFAGGVHDERSAAMVAALAGPLAERGAGVRVLMGTAYLFTTEAVAAGAIPPGFQDVALGCRATVLLETFPGHATRCARTPYVRTFEETRRELEQVGTPTPEVWRRLEKLNLGRLRVASKGMRRSTPVDTDVQREEGMFPLGQAAALRSATTTIVALHDQVTSGATAFLAGRAAELGIAGPEAAPAARPPADIAIIGMGCVFPGARDADEYWANIVGGVDAVTEVTRWDPEVHYSPDEEGRTPSKWGGFIPEIPFDASAYGIPPHVLGGIDPVQLLSLEVASRALADAGYGDRPFDRSRTSVVFGAEGGGDLGIAYGVRATLPSYYGEVPQGLDEQLPRPSGDSLPGVLTSAIAGRIADRLDLGGPGCTVDAAGASSLAALDAACKDLAAGTSDMVLCGGADLRTGVQDYLLLASAGALSPSGRCAAFDAAADGVAPGEGVACVVLKRLADAERDGDRIYAVVKAVAGASGGLTAPGSQGRRRALERAYERARVAPDAVGLVEADGAGTEAGDRAELAALTSLFSPAAQGAVTLGSVKSQIGHTRSAAGLAGLIKTAQALHAGVLPGTLHLTRPAPDWTPDGPFAFAASARPWAVRPGGRYAGVSASGLGGADFHAVLAGYEGAPEPVSGLAEWPAELFLIRGADRSAARAEIDRLTELLGGRPRLRDLARTAASSEGPVQVALVASGPDDLREKLALATEFRAAPGVFAASGRDPGQVAFLFPGEGGGRPGMLAGLFVAFPRLQRLLRLAGGRYAAAMYPPAAFTRAESRRHRAGLTDPRVGRPAAGIAGLAVHRLLTAVGVHPDLAAGHGPGELTALCAAGVVDDAGLVELSAAAAAPPTEGVPLAAGASDALCAELLGRDLRSPAFPVWSNLTAAPYGADAGELAATLAGHLAAPVRFAEQIEAMYDAGARTFVEAGPGRALTGLVGGILGDRPHTAVSCDAPGENDLAGLLAALAALAAAGVPVDPLPLFAGRGARALAGPPAAAPGWLVGGHLVRNADGGHPPGGLRPAERIDPPGADAAEAAVLEYLRAGREMIAAQREVVMRHLADRHSATPAPGPADPAPADPAPSVPAPRPVVTEEALSGEAMPGEALSGEASAGEEPGAALDVRATVLAVLSARTGRPESLLDDGLDLEADLAIDSAGRTVIAGELAHRTGVALPEPGHLAGVTTVGEIVSWLEGRLGAAPAGPALPAVPPQARSAAHVTSAALSGGPPPAPSLAPETTAGGVTGVMEEEPVPLGLARHVMRIVDLDPLPAPPDSGTAFAGRRFLVVDDGCGVALELATMLERHGAQVRTPTDVDEPCDGLVHLAALRPGAAGVLPQAFEDVRRALDGGLRWLVFAGGAGGTFGRRFEGRGAGDPAPGAGLRGLATAIAHEYPEVLVRALDTDTKNTPRAIARQILAELLTVDGPVAVGHEGDLRHGLDLVPADLPAESGLDLGPDGVVLLTGGARGMTARVALELARTSGCHIEIMGRAPEPAGEPEFPEAEDEAALRRVLVARGEAGPAEIEATIRRVLAGRETRRNLAALREHAASVRYHDGDVRDPYAVRNVVGAVYQRHERLDGVIHGAGRAAGRLVRDMAPESFEQAYRTRVDGAAALVQAVRSDLEFFVVLGGVAGARGGRGQAGPAAAAEACGTLAHVWRTRLRGRVLAADCGPWPGSAAPEPGVGPVDPDAAAAALLREIAHGGETHVVFTGTVR